MMTSDELMAEYERVASLCDKAGREYDRLYRAQEVAHAIGVQPLTITALDLLYGRSERRYQRLCILRHAAFGEWRNAMETTK